MNTHTPGLTARQRARLRALAHRLKPLLHVGKEGVTSGAVQAIEEAFHTRELLKVKVQQAAPCSAAEAGADLAGHLEGAYLVQTIGRTVVLYRPHPDNPRLLTENDDREKGE